MYSDRVLKRTNWWGNYQKCSKNPQPTQNLESAETEEMEKMNWAELDKLISYAAASTSYSASEITDPFSFEINFILKAKSQENKIIFLTSLNLSEI